MKHLNIIVFVVLSSIYILLSSNIKISTNFLEALFSKESTKLFDVANELGYSNEILIATKGFDDTALDELYAIGDELSKVKSITKVSIDMGASLEMQEYFKKNYYLLADFNNTLQEKEAISKKMQKMYDDISSSVMYTPVNSNDPLNLFSMSLGSANSYLKLKDYGYILKATTDVNTANADEVRILYADIQMLLKNHEETLSFAPFYFLVENSAYIKNDATTIIVLSSILLLVMYFLILKSYRLFFHTVLALASSAIAAIIVSSLMFDSLNILALAFGISITTISVDYMFHYYFHKDFSHKGFIKQKRVLFGFITTFGVFFIFSNIDIKLFAQLSLFSAVSLGTAYLLFSYVFTYLEIAPPQLKAQKKELKSFNPLYILLLSFLMLGYSYFNLEFDKNLRNLDYQNEKLLEISQKFTETLGKDKYTSVIISGKTPEEILQRYESLEEKHPSLLGVGKFVYSDNKCQKKLANLQEYDFEKLKKDISSEASKAGFKDIFSSSYSGVDTLQCDMKILDDMKFKIVQIEDIFYTLALVNKGEIISEEEGITVLDMGKVFSKNIENLKDELLLFMLISIVFIMAVLFSISRFEMLYPLSYVLFPVSVVLFSLSLFSSLNIMHIFALVILIAIGIDYGIYMHKTTSLVETTTAIRYALLSTFAGFGVLIFSSVTALYSIGVVITLGIGAIFALLLYKREI